MPRRRPSQLRAEARLLARPTAPLRRPKVGGSNLSGAARAAVLRFEHQEGLTRGSLLVALEVWARAPGVVDPPVPDCGVWECCGYDRPLAQAIADTRDIIEDLIRRTPSGAGRELRRHVRDADFRMVGALDGFWWRDEWYWL